MTYVAQYKAGPKWQTVMASNRSTPEAALKVATEHFNKPKTRPKLRTVPIARA